MFKRTLNRLLIRIKRVTYHRGPARQYEQRLSDHRVVATALRMARELAQSQPKLATPHQPQAAKREQRDTTPASLHQEGNAEIDRIVARDPKGVHLTRHRKVVDFQRPWGTC